MSHTPMPHTTDAIPPNADAPRADVPRADAPRAHAPREGLPEYAALLAARHAAHRPELERLLADLCGGRDWAVLDLACGDGFYAELFDGLLGPDGSVTAADLSPAFLDWAAARIADARGPSHRVRFLQADATRLPVADGTFDLVWCAQSLISLPDPAATLAEMRRVVRPGGLVAVLENDRLHEMQMPWPVPLELALRRAEREADDPQTAGDTPYVGRFLGRMLAEAGLRPLRRVTLAVDRMPPWDRANEAFLRACFHKLLEGAAEVLDRPRCEELRRLTDPASPQYLPRQPGFWITWTDALFVAVREPEGESVILNATSHSPK